MDCPLCPSCRDFPNRPRARISLWAPLAIIAFVLGAAAIASAMTADTRDFAARHGSVPTHGRAL